MGKKWQYRLMKCGSYLLCRLSYPHLIRLGKWLGPTVLGRLKSTRRRAEEQISTAFQCTPSQTQEILQKHFENLGISVLEIFYTPRLVKEKERLAEFIEIDHPERLAEALADQKGVIGLTAHFGNWEWLGAGLSLAGFPTTTIAKRQPNDQVTRILNEFRTLAGLDVFHSGGSELIGAARAMKSKKILGFVADKDGGVDGVPVMFLNRISSAVEGPAVFAKRFDAPIVPLFITRKPDGAGHVIHVGEPFYYENTGDSRHDIDQLTEKMTKIIESYIHLYPPEWLWIQRRWWTSPEEMRRYGSKEEDKCVSGGG